MRDLRIAIRRSFFEMFASTVLEAIWFGVRGKAEENEQTDVASTLSPQSTVTFYWTRCRWLRETVDEGRHLIYSDLFLSLNDTRKGGKTLVNVEKKA